jgi:hypothetical protein
MSRVAACCRRDGVERETIAQMENADAHSPPRAPLVAMLMGFLRAENMASNLLSNRVPERP